MYSPMMLICFSLLFALHTADAADWGYVGHTGPSHWKDINANCGGSSQSPINIDTDNLETIEYEPWEFHNYDVILANGTNVINNGHTVQLNTDPLDKFVPGYKLSGGGLPSTYKVLQIHFHWADNNDEGSEHTRNGAHYPIEMHIVHWDSGNYPFPPAAVEQPLGLAVLGVWIEVGEENLNFKPMIDSLSTDNVMYKTPRNGEYHVPETDLFKLDDWLPADTSRFYRYNGSLTTPNCYESVVWTLFEDPIQMSLDQIEMFRKAYENELPSDSVPETSTMSENSTMSDNSTMSPSTTMKPSHHIGMNFRPVQALNSRTVYRSSSFSATTESTTGGAMSGSRHFNTFAYVILLCVVYLMHAQLR